MASANDFYFGLLRVSMIQLLKSQGFDRAKPTTVDVVTDLYMRYLGLLTGELLKLANSRCDLDDTVSLQDITLAFQNLGVIKPVDLLDIYDENPELSSDKGMKKFKEWCLHDIEPKESRIVAFPNANLLKSRAKSSKPLSLIPEYINQLQQKQDPMQDHKGNEEDELIEELINDGDLDDWIKFILARQRINLAKRISGKDPHHISDLPSIGGFKNSSLESHTQSSSNCDSMPISLGSAEEDDMQSKPKMDELVQRLPIMRPECKLDNITLSFENEAYDSSTDENEQELQLQNSFDFVADQENKHNAVEPSINEFSLDPGIDTNFGELDNMDGTLQRKDYLDLDEHPQDFQFDIDGF